MRRIKILEDDDPILRQVAEPVDLVFDHTMDIKRIADEMVSVMRGVRAIGIAAPQIGYSKRIIAVKLKPEVSWEDDDKYRVFINPELFKRHPVFTLVGPEQCLSVPGKTAYVMRDCSVYCRGYTATFNEFTVQCDDLLAVVVQHEVDHLNGILMTDEDLGVNLNGLMSENFTTS